MAFRETTAGRLVRLLVLIIVVSMVTTLIHADSRDPSHLSSDSDVMVSRSEAAAPLKLYYNTNGSSALISLSATVRYGIFSDQSILSRCYSETDCNIAIAISKDKIE